MMVGLNADVSVQTHRKIKKRKKEKEKLLIYYCRFSNTTKRTARDSSSFYILRSPLFLSFFLSFSSLCFSFPLSSYIYSYLLFSFFLSYSHLGSTPPTTPILQGYTILTQPPDHGPACPRLTGYAVLKQNQSFLSISNIKSVHPFDQTERY